ncbi:MAG TPA: type II secretion system protein GspM [Candidatus Acidoferrum sp.]|nr:type II secretion system protein GspM [Candidatus Acidoferrum sp.]
MKRSEKQLVIVFAALFALVLIVRVVPLVGNYYRSGRDDIAKLQERIDRYRKLIVDTAEWQQKQQLKTAEVNDMQGWIFAGTDPNLVASSLQRSLRQLMAENNVDVRETGVARYNYVGKWLMVEQDMSFSLNQPAILPFLRALDAARPRLQVSALSINRNRRAFTGSLTVVGFAKTADKGATGENGVRAALPPAASQSQPRGAGNATLTPFSPAVKP